MVKAVIFDLDGTLLNREASVLHFIASQYDRLKDELKHIPKEQYISKFIEIDSKGYVWKDQVYRQLVNEFKITKITSEELLGDYLSNFKNSVIPFENVIPMLKTLQTMKLELGMITNGRTKFQMDSIKELQIEQYFKTIIISEAAGLKKPDLNIFRMALEELQVIPYESVYVGDHPDNDIRSAKRLGMKTIWKRDDYWEKPEADAIVEQLDEITQIIDTWKQKLEGGEYH